MKTGDLVQLSARGQKDQWLSGYRGLHGIVIEEHPQHYAHGSFRVHWFETKNYQRPVHHFVIPRGSLKRYK